MSRGTVTIRLFDMQLTENQKGVVRNVIPARAGDGIRINRLSDLWNVGRRCRGVGASAVELDDRMIKSRLSGQKWVLLIPGLKKLCGMPK
jgi:hypothetical protein